MPKRRKREQKNKKKSRSHEIFMEARKRCASFHCVQTHTLHYIYIYIFSLLFVTALSTVGRAEKESQRGRKTKKNARRFPVEKRKTTQHARARYAFDATPHCASSSSFCAHLSPIFHAFMVYYTTKFLLTYIGEK